MKRRICLIGGLLAALAGDPVRAEIGEWPDLYDPFRIRTIYLEMESNNWGSVVSDSDFDDPQNARLWSDGESPVAVTVKRKSDPAIGQKVSVKIDINARVPGQTWHGVKKLSLENGAEGGLVKEGLAWAMHRMASEGGFYDYPSAYAAWVRLVVDGQLIGVYTSVEERDKQMLENRGLWKENATWLYKNDPNAELEAGSGNSPTYQHLCYSPFRNNCGQPDLESDLPLWIDMQGMLTLGAIEAFTGNHDGLFTHDGKNHFFADFAPPTQLKRLYFPWDLDTGISSATASILGYGGDYSGQILGHPWFRQWFLHTLSELLDGPLSAAMLIDFLDRLEPVLTPALLEDPNGSVDGDPAGHFQSLRQWVTNRIANVRTQIGRVVGPPGFNPPAGEIIAGAIVTLAHTNAAGTVCFTLDGSDPRAVGGVVSGTAYLEPLVLTNTTHIAARVRDGTNWSNLRRGTFNVAGHARAMRVTELMYQPRATGTSFEAGEYEFIELQNQSGTPVNLSGCELDGVGYRFQPGTIVGASNFVVLVRNAIAFTNRYPGVAYHGIYKGALDNDGEKIRFRNSERNNIFSVEYDDEPPWPLGANGFGWSLVNRDPAGNPDDPVNWRASANGHGSPGAVDPPPPYSPGLVISEVLAHTDPPQEDAVELHNPTAAPIDISGWWLSDQSDNDDPGGALLKKFRIPANTLMAPGGFAVFYQSNFNASSLGTNAFALSSLGDQVYLASASSDGTLSGCIVGATFGASDNGVVFGQTPKSQGFDFATLQTPTLGATNAPPRVGPVVINEISYHPDNDGAEYVELFNAGATNVDLSGWTLGGAAFVFPSGTSIGTGGYVVLVGSTNFSAASFRSAYNVPPGVPVFVHPFDLGNAGEALVLSKPNDPPTNAPITVDRVRFNDKGLWPTEADGLGPSLERASPAAYGNEPLNWITTAAGASPGRANAPTNLLAIVRGSKWKHHHHARNLGTAWRESDYSDSGWVVDRAPLGYGYAALRTILTNPPGVATNPVTTYFRKEFVIPHEPQGITNLLLSVACDDGFVAYLNGQEVVRRSLALGSVTHLTLAAEHASAGYESIDLTAARALLRRGANVFAVEVHQASVNDAEMFWDTELSCEASTTPLPSELRIVDITVNASSVTLRWASSPGQRYRVQRSTDLLGWVNISLVLTAFASTHEFTDPTPLARGFYRVQLSE